MKLDMHNTTQPHKRGFTLVEMLVVIAIIAILASILIPVIGRSRTKAKVVSVKSEMAAMVAAIKTYKTDYTRWPAPAGAEKNIYGDLTFGWNSKASGRYIDNNDVMRILMAEATGGNANNARNPKKTQYFQPKDSADPEMEGEPGLTTGRRYNDLFGNDYKITMDLDGDGLCADVFYGRPEVSKAASMGLVDRRQVKGAGNEIYVLKGEVMIWTFGPDKQYSDGKGAGDELNADNILSWN